MFRMNNYSQTFVERQLTSPLNPFKLTGNEEEEDTTKTVTIPYIKDTSEKISRILRPHGVRVARRPMTTLRSVVTKLKDPAPAECRRGAIYEINCS